MEKNKIVRIILAIVSIVAVLILECVSASKFILAKSILLFLNFIIVLTFVKGGKRNALRILLVTLLYLALFSWFLPAASFQTEFANEGFSQIGLFDLLSNYFATSIQYFGTFALFVLVVGGFYGVLHMIPAYRSLLDKMAKALEGNERLFIFVTIIMLAVLTSVCGMQLGLLIFFPFLAALILLLGYDKIVVVLTLVGSTMVGIMGTTVASTNISYLVSYLAGSEEAVNFSTALGTRTAVLLLGIIVLMIATMKYMKKSATVTGSVAAKEVDTPVIIKEVTATKTTKKTTKKKTVKKTNKGSKNRALAMEKDVIAVKDEERFAVIPSEVKKSQKAFPVVLSFVVMFIIFVLSFIPCASTLNVNFFDKITSEFVKIKIFGFPLFGKLLTSNTESFNAFGAWTITDLIPVLIVVCLFLALVYKVKMVDFVDGFIRGVKKAVVPAGIVILVYVGLVIVTFHSYQLSIYASMLDLANGHFNIGAQILTAFATMLSGFFNSDPTYAFNALVPYFTSIFTDTSVYPQVMVLMQSMYGLVMLLAPTSLILVIVLCTMKVSFREWLKSTWLLLVVLFVSILLITIIWSPIFTWILVGLFFLLFVFLVTEDWVWRIFAFICEILLALIFIFAIPVLTGILLGLMIIGFVMIATKDWVLRILGIIFAILLALMIALHIKMLTIIGIILLIIIFIVALVYVGLKS